MAAVLLIISILLCMFGAYYLTECKTGFQEIQAGIILIIAAINFVGCWIVNETALLRKDLKKIAEEKNKGGEK